MVHIFSRVWHVLFTRMGTARSLFVTWYSPVTDLLFRTPPIHYVFDCINEIARTQRKSPNTASFQGWALSNHSAFASRSFRRRRWSRQYGGEGQGNAVS